MLLLLLQTLKTRLHQNRGGSGGGALGSGMTTAGSGLDMDEPGAPVKCEGHPRSLKHCTVPNAPPCAGGSLSA